MNRLAGIALSLAVMLGAATGMAQAQDYPTKPIKLIGPFAAGGSGDVTARLIADFLEKRWGQSVIVENRVGGGGLLGSDAVKRAAPDGYTLLMGYDGITSFSLFLKDNTLDQTKDLAPISLLVRYPLVMLTSTALPVKTTQEFIAYAKANPGKINYGIITNSPSHLYGALLAKKAGLDMAFIPYPGAAALTQSMLAGETHATMSLYGSFVPAIKDGKVIALNSMSTERMKQAPDVPTMREGGVDILASIWYGLFAPAGTPQPIIDKLAAAAKDWTKAPNVIEQAERLRMDLVGGTPAELAKLIVDDTAARAEAAKAGNIQPQ